MSRISEIRKDLSEGRLDEKLKELYPGTKDISQLRDRYLNALFSFEKLYLKDSELKDCEVSIFSAPGRSEIGGNHTDHQRGRVLVAAVDADAIAVVQKTDDEVVQVVSEGYEKIVISLTDLKQKKREEGATAALIKGVLKGTLNKGYKIGGFRAYVTSWVPAGAGLSSSAAFETLLGSVLSGLYNDMKISPVETAMTGRYAENEYFGKPCGLMDQMASSVGNLVYIDFLNEENPIVEAIDFNLTDYGYSLCITDTKSSHANCTDEYAAIPGEMKAVAELLGHQVLREVSLNELMANINKIREKKGDRAFLRSLHFVQENERVKNQAMLLKEGRFDEFLSLVKDSGDSSFKYLQNIYIGSDVKHQNVSLALFISDIALKGKGVSRVHGGGFAGTIQAFVKEEAVKEYAKSMDGVFGEGACHIYKIRKYGGIKVI